MPEPEVAGHNHEVEQQEGHHHQEEEHVETMNTDDTLSQFNDAVSEPVPSVPRTRPKRLKQQNRKQAGAELGQAQLKLGLDFN